jgi:hypothetical protein
MFAKLKLSLTTKVKMKHQRPLDVFLTPPTTLRFLVCCDIDAISAAKLSEKFVPLPSFYDGIIAVGPFYHEECESKEDEATALGEIASTIAQLENIVCRVMYLPSAKDPLDMIIEQSHLTPNSVGIHGRRLNLTSDLYLMGFTEKTDSSRVPNSSSIGDHRVNLEEMENIEVVSGVSSSIIRDMLINREEKHIDSSEKKSDQSANSTETGIFVFKYHFAHTLNEFLFHMNEEIEKAGVDLCIIASNADASIGCETSRLPSKFGKLSLCAPRSLRQGGYYSTVEMKREGDRWNTSVVEHHQLESFS